MQKLLDGLHDFQANVFATRREFFERLALGQRPEVLFITCSDSRINPAQLTQADPGELFIMRTPATSSRPGARGRVGRPPPSSSASPASG